MFRSRRSTLVKRLWKCNVGQNEGDSASQGSIENRESIGEMKAVLHSLLKRLKDSELEVLVKAVESRGADTTASCVVLNNAPLQLGKRTVEPHVLCCSIWRWGQVNREKLKRMPYCSTVDNSSLICCNPYHWSLSFSPDNLPPLFEKAYSEKLFNSEGSVNMKTASSQETGNTPTALRNSDVTSVGGSYVRRPFWCNVAYWEHDCRVGRLLTVSVPYLHIFQHVSAGGDGMCLGVLQQQTCDKKMERLRERIGLGILLSNENDGIWLYNRSEQPVFAHSPTLQLPDQRTLIVEKLPPGYSIKLFDYHLSQVFEELRDPKLLDGPYDPYSARISLGKGWGPRYSRQFITSCPCWLEVLFKR